MNTVFCGQEWRVESGDTQVPHLPEDLSVVKILRVTTSVCWKQVT